MRVSIPIAHIEGEIPPEFKHEFSDGEFWCFITNFELRDLKTNCLKSPEFITEEGIALIMTGCLITPEQHRLSKTSSSSSSDMKANFYVRVTNLKQWAFDHEDDTKGIWIESRRHWYKLIKPTSEFRTVYEAFEKKSNIWLDLRPILTRWIKKLDKCTDDQVENVINSLTMEHVVELMKQKGHSMDEIIENAFFIYDKVMQDVESFSFEDSTDCPLLRTPFIKDLLEVSSEKSKYQSQQAELVMDQKDSIMVDDFSSDDEVKIIIEDSSSSSDSSDDDYNESVVIIPPDEDDNESSDDEKDKDYELVEKKRTKSTLKGTPDKQKQKRPYKKRKEKVATEKKLEKKRKSTKLAEKLCEDDYDDDENDDDDDNDDNDEPGSKRKRRKPEKPRKATLFYFREYNLQPGIPTTQEFLSQEFTPRLITQLSTKYDAGMIPKRCHQCHRKRIICLKERPICSHCLEDGLECSYPPKLLIARKYFILVFIL